MTLKYFDFTAGYETDVSASIGDISTLEVPLTLKQQTSVTDPASGYNKIYPKSDNKLYIRFSDGTEKGMGGLDVWVTGTAYTGAAGSGDVVYYTDNRIYRCLSTHTSGTFATDLAAGKWVAIGGSGVIITTKTGDATLSASEYTGGLILLDSSSATVNITLPTASTVSGIECTLKCIDATNGCSIVTSCDGATQYFAEAYTWYKIVSNGTLYYIVGRG